MKSRDAARRELDRILSDPDAKPSSNADVIFLLEEILRRIRECRDGAAGRARLLLLLHMQAKLQDLALGELRALYRLITEACPEEVAEARRRAAALDDLIPGQIAAHSAAVPSSQENLS